MPIDPAKPFDLTFRVDPNWNDLRLDRFVKAMVPSMSRTRIQKYIKAGRVEVNGTPRSANWKARTGDEVLLRCNVPEDGADAGRHIPLSILYEDGDIVAVNKQPGLIVHPVSLHRHDTLLNALYWRYKDELPPDQEISLANRLDEHTSGVVLVAKHRAAKQVLQEQFERRLPRKTYLALCLGLVPEDEAEIDLPIGPAPGRSDRCLMGVRHDSGGKQAFTSLRVEERFPLPPAFAAAAGQAGLTLLRLFPRTGRQHQLRVHLAAIGHPLVCDDRYGDGRDLRLPGAEALLTRYALHAAELVFAHPADGREMRIRAPLHADMRATVRALRALRPG